MHVIDEQVIDNPHGCQQQDEIGHAVHGLQKSVHGRQRVRIEFLHGPAPIWGFTKQIANLYHNGVRVSSGIGQEAIGRWAEIRNRVSGRNYRLHIRGP